MNIDSQVMSCLPKKETELFCEVSKQATRTVSTDKFLKMIERFVKTLSALDLVAGDRIAIIGKNSANWVAAFMAIARSHMVSVLIDCDLSKEEMHRQIELTQLQAIICDDELVEELDFVTIAKLSDAAIVRMIARDDTLPLCKPEESTIVFSSGTTSLASGILHTHDSLIESCLLTAREQGLDGGRYLGVLPLSHIYGLITTMIGPLLFGATICYVQESDGALIAQAMQDYQPTVFPGVARLFAAFRDKVLATANSSGKLTAKLFGIMYQLCSATREKFGWNLGKLLMKKVHHAFGGKIETLCCAGSPVDPIVAKFFLDCGFDFIITYGATETGIPTIGFRRGKLGHIGCGTPYPDVQIKMGENNELLIKTPRRMVCYWGNPEMTEVAFVDNWFKSGDIFTYKNGRVVITGRCKDAIVMDTGKKIDPTVIEDCLTGIEDVIDLAVCGIQQENGSDDIHVFITSKLSSIVNIVRNIKSIKLEQGAVVKDVHLIDSIPRTALQKPKRYLLRKWFEEHGLIANVVGEICDSDWDQFVSVIARIGNAAVADVRPESRLFLDFQTDSLSSFELLCELEEKFKIKLTTDLDRNLTVGALWKMVQTPSADTVTRKYPMTRSTFSFAMFKFCRGLCSAVYRTRSHGEENIPRDTGYILCANHVSMLDALWLTIGLRTTQLKNLFGMAKIELAKTRLGKFGFKVFGMIPVERGGIAGGAMAACREVLKKGAGLIVFPEGTRVRNGQLGEFKPGPARLALESNAPLVPAYIDGSLLTFPRILGRLSGATVDVFYGRPINPEGHTLESLTTALKDAVDELRLSIIKK